MAKRRVNELVHVLIHSRSGAAHVFRSAKEAADFRGDKRGWRYVQTMLGVPEFGWASPDLRDELERLERYRIYQQLQQASVVPLSPGDTAPIG